MRSDDERVRKRRRGTDAYVFAALTVASFTMMLLSTRSFVLDVQEVGLSAFSGARGAVTAVAGFFARTAGSVKELATLREQYAELSLKLEKHEALERDAAELKMENRRLSELLGFSRELSYRQVPARIVGRDPDNLFSAFVVDKGARHGIKRGMTVIGLQDGVQGLVGKIVQVGRSESLLMPVYDANANVAARFSESRYEGLVSGLGDPDHPLIMRYIKKRAKDEIHYGDVVVSSGMSGIYPKGLAVGRVVKIIAQEYATSMEAELETAIDFSRLEYVFIIEENKEPADD